LCDVDHSASCSRSVYSPNMDYETPFALRPLSRHAARIANEQLAALCHRRASKWADAIREGLDPDIARFIRDQAAAWQLLANSYGRFAGHEEKSARMRSNQYVPIGKTIGCRNVGKLVRG
jgi:hypothetical protein